ncbi:ras-related protein Rab-22A-like isoform X2 [Sycon ciliatum]|uniref:ras-related protein Rab-22A-like isoform X2 n=1 Tax=Sycon ciliatum TaxID=27933 RepID=UPI0031F61C15
MAREVKLCLLGDTGVGKTCLVLRFVTNTFNENSECTVGASFMTKSMVVDNKTIKFHIWDTAGQERYRGLAPMYYRGAAAAILVYDITNKVPFEQAQHYADQIGAVFIETSALEATNVNEIFISICQKLPPAEETQNIASGGYQSLSARPESNKHDTILLTQTSRSAAAKPGKASTCNC